MNNLNKNSKMAIENTINSKARNKYDCLALIFEPQELNSLSPPIIKKIVLANFKEIEESRVSLPLIRQWLAKYRRSNESALLPPLSKTASNEQEVAQKPRERTFTNIMIIDPETEGNAPKDEPYIKPVS